MKELEKKLGYTFRDKSLLKTALTHSSYANENKRGGSISNERLEFLGDSVLGMIMATYIYKSRPKMPEGQMTRLRAELVCEKSLATLASTLKLGEYLLLGHGEEKGGGRERPSILADAVEAVLAAMYLDGGIAAAEGLLTRYLAPQAEKMQAENFDYKTVLQETVQEKGGQTPSYQITDESGPDHEKVFSAAVYLDGRCIGAGIGRSKKEAEQSAARTALDGMRK